MIVSLACLESVVMEEPLASLDVSWTFVWNFHSGERGKIPSLVRVLKSSSTRISFVMPNLWI